MPDTARPPPDIEVEREIDPAKPTRESLLRTIFLGCLLALAVLAACYAAAEIVLPVVLAFVLNAVFQPVMRLLLQVHVPRILAALLVVLALVSLFLAFGLLLSGPLTGWIEQLPYTLPKLQERASFLSTPFKALQEALGHVQKLAPADTQAIAVQTTPMSQRVLEEVRLVAGGAFTTLLLLFFVLIAGDQFLRRLVEILPNYRNKRQAVEISQQIEQDISIYLGTITLMNTAVGVLTGLMAWLTGLGDPLLWGTVAFLLNYVPILGPTVGVILFLVVGLVTVEPPWAAFLPPLLYLMIHLAEGETITPMLLAARFTVNPVLVTLGVVFWYWMWGVVGAVLSTPMLAIAKIVCDRIDSLKPVGHFIGGEPVLAALGTKQEDGPKS